MQILQETGIDWCERTLINRLYMAQRVKLKLDHGETSRVYTGRGVRQGCCLSPILFNWYSERKLLNSLFVCFLYVCLFVLAQQPTVCQGLLIHEVSRSYPTTHHSRLVSSGRVISPSQRPLPNNTQRSQKTDIHAPGGIRTHILNRRVAAELNFRPRGHCERLLNSLATQNRTSN
jgi:hypothetical protein